MTLDEYIEVTYQNNPLWFEDEVNKPYNVKRISGVIANRDYLSGRHKVLNREDAMYKGKTLVTNKTVLNYAKTVLSFHNTYVLGKPVSIVSSDDTIAKTFTDIYKLGQYETVDYEIIDRVNKFGDAYEVVYVDNGTIKSKILDSGDCYPVYDDFGTYLAFIEHWTDAFSNISYYNVYYDGYVEHWNNDGAVLHMTGSDVNVCGLPIHYHNFSDIDYNFGESILTDIKPIMDDLEDILAKMGTAVYVNSLNPMNVATGQRIESTIPADATGFVLNLDNGDYKVVSTMMDYSTIQLYLDNMKQMLNDIACIPNVLGGNASIANVSEVSLRLLFHMANVKAMETEKWLNIGFMKRFDKFKNILAKLNIPCNGNVNVEYNLSIPVATNEVVANLKTMREIGAISLETVMEKSDLIKDVAVEKERLNGEYDAVENVENPSNKVGNEDIK